MACPDQKDDILFFAIGDDVGEFFVLNGGIAEFCELVQLQIQGLVACVCDIQDFGTLSEQGQEFLDDSLLQDIVFSGRKLGLYSVI